MTAAAEQNAEEDQDPDPLIIVEKIAEASHIVILSLYRLDGYLVGERCELTYCVGLHCGKLCLSI